MRTQLNPKLLSLALSFLAVAYHSSFAAVAVDMHQQTPAYLQGLLTTPITDANTASVNSSLKMVNSNVDFNHTKHVRYQQVYRGYTVWGGEVIMHVPHANHSNAALAQTSANGFYYDKLENDLGSPPVDETQRSMVASKSAAAYLKSMQLQGDITQLQAQTLVYVDAETHKATWSYLITFSLRDVNGRVYEPSMIVDAQSEVIYKQWDRVEDETDETVSVGGYGGNESIGKIAYGLGGTYPAFSVERISSYNPTDKNFRGNCYMHDSLVQIVEGSYPENIEYYFPCHSTDSTHANLYWDDTFMSINGGYSPPNDAVYGVHVVSDFFKVNYELPVYAEADHVTPKQIIVEFPPYSPSDYSNWNTVDNDLYLGIGGDGYYPFTSVGVIAHELAHAFTSQHSNLEYLDGSGAMNEAFSDLAAQAVQYYQTGKNDWRIGKEVIADPMAAGCKDVQDCAIRYMDNPAKDEKSFDNVVQAYIYHPANHYGSGVFNKMFYLLATKPNWNTKMVFDVMVQANMNYWTRNVTINDDYKQIACGIIAAAKDYHAKDARYYDVTDVISALKGVGFKDDGLPGSYPMYDYDLKSCE